MYEAYYGLNEKPFNLTPDPSFLYLSEKHKEAFAHLLYGIRSRCGFIMVSGEIGTGKTTICRSLLSRLDPDTEVAFIFNPCLSPVELIRKINEDFGISSQAETLRGLIDELNVYLLARASEGKNCVLVIDEAQSLDPSVLEQVRLLSNLETERQKLLQIVLIGQPELAEMLELPELRQLNQRITARYHLKELDRQETLHYIAFRLRIAGSRCKAGFTRPAVRAVYAFSGGTPRVINAICDRALLIGFTLDHQKITRAIIRRAIKEVRGERPKRKKRAWARPALPTSAYVTAVAAIVCVVFLVSSQGPKGVRAVSDVWEQARALVPSGGNPIQRVVPPGAIVIPEPVEKSALEPESVEVARVENPAPSVSAKAVDDLGAATPETEVEALPKILSTDLVETPEESQKQSLVHLVELNEMLEIVGKEKARNRGLAAIFGQWGMSVSSEYPRGEDLSGVPSFAQAHGLSFLWLGANFEQVLTINLPALIQVRGRESDFWLGLVGVETQKAYFSAGGESVYEVPLESVSEQYTGRVTFLWKDPTPEANILVPWQSSPNVAAFQDMLRSLGLLDDEVYGTFDQKTITAVRKVQQASGLWVDGIIGEQTRMVLTSWMDSTPTPSLLQVPFPAEARQRVLNQRIARAQERPPKAAENVPGRLEETRSDSSSEGAETISNADVQAFVDEQSEGEPTAAITAADTPVDSDASVVAVESDLENDSIYTLSPSQLDLANWAQVVVVEDITEPRYEPRLETESAEVDKAATESSPGMYPLVPSEAPEQKEGVR